jgi:hypothetical protein
LIAKSQPFCSQDLAINPEPSIPQNPAREEEITPLKNSFEFKGNLIDFGRTVNTRPRKRPPSTHIPNPLKEESLRKRSYSHIGRREEPKDGMSNDAIEGEQSHLEDNLIFSPCMLRQDDLSEPIFKPILDPDEFSYALSPKPHDDPRNPQRQMKHRSHEDHKDDQEWLRQWLECMKNTYAVVKEWMDEDETLWLGSKLG